MPEEVVSVVNSDIVEILAPPAEIHITVGVGATGLRGSRIYAGNPSPETFFASFPETPMVSDVYIAVNDQQMFQLTASPTGPVWTLLFDIAALSGGGGPGGGGTGGFTFGGDVTYSGLYVLTGAPGGTLIPDPDNDGLFLTAAGTSGSIVPDSSYAGLYVII